MKQTVRPMDHLDLPSFLLSYTVDYDISFWNLILTRDYIVTLRNQNLLQTPAELKKGH